MAGWRWLFIIGFLVTIPIALYVFILFPDTPETTKAFYLTKEEKKLSVRRLSDHATEHAHGELGTSIFRRVLGTWEVYALSGTILETPPILQAKCDGKYELHADNELPRPN